MIRIIFSWFHNFWDYDQKNQIVTHDRYGNTINIDQIILIIIGIIGFIICAFLLWALFNHISPAYCNTEWYHG